MKLADRIKIQPSVTAQMNQLAEERKLAGKSVYNFSVGEPMVDTSKLIIKAAHLAMSSGYTHYPPIRGLKELRSAAVNWLSIFYQADYSNKEVIVTVGGKFAIYLAIQALINPGDEVVVFNPSYVSYQQMVKMAGGVVKTIQTRPDNNWQIEIDELEYSISSKTKLIILNNGNNPTGAIYDEKILKSILKLAVEKDIIVLSDEVYSGLSYEKEYISAGSFNQFHNNLLIIQSCSKNFAMTGWRVGFCFGPKEIITAMSVIQSQSLTNTSIISQYAAIAALNNAGKIMNDINLVMRKRRDKFVNKFNSLFSKKIDYPPSALYAFVSLVDLGSKGNYSEKFCFKTLEDCGVALVPGSAFGQEGYVRFSYGINEQDIENGLITLQNYLSKQ